MYIKKKKMSGTKQNSEHTEICFFQLFTYACLLVKWIGLLSLYNFAPFNSVDLW